MKMESHNFNLKSNSDVKMPGEISNPAVGFKLLEEDYSQIISNLTQHDRLGHYANEFQRLMDALTESYLREREMYDRNLTLQNLVESNASKFSDAMKASYADQEKIEKLQKEVSKAWKMIDMAHTREQAALETIENLRLQASRLTQEIETLRKMGSDQDQEVGALSKNKEAMAREKERLLNEIQNAREKYANGLKYTEELEKRNEATELKLSEVSTELELQKSDFAKERRFKEKIEEELKDLKAEVANKDQELYNQSNQLTQKTKTIGKLELQQREDKTLIERQNKELQELQNANRLQKMEFEQLSGNIERLQQEAMSRNLELKSKEDDIVKLRCDLKRLQSTKDSLENKVSVLSNEKGVLEGKKKELQTKITTFEKEVLALKVGASSDKKALDNMSREKDMMSKTVQKTMAYTKQQQQFISLQELNKKKLQEEVQEQSGNLIKQKTELSAMQNEKDRYLAETINLNTQIQNQLENLKLKEMELFDCKKIISNSDAKMKLQLALYEQVRSERNQLSKNLIEASDEIHELKHKLKVKTYQGQQMKEDIRTKETILIKEQFTLKKVTKEKEELRTELQDVLNKIREKREEVKSLLQEESRLQKIIQEGDRERAKLQKDLNQVTNERDVLGTQLVRRNDELSLLHEKIKILQSVLQKGEAQYGQRVEDIRLLKIEIKNLRQEKAMLARSMNNISDLRQEIFHIERDFIKERLKCRALEEELQNPLNVHRWRKLEGSDPTTYELIQKIQILQRRLLKSSEDAIRRESQFKSMERLYLNLKQLLARQPGPEAMVKLKKCQNAFKQRGIKMKCLIAELTMFENQVHGYKFEKDTKEKELNELKKKFFLMKKREQKVKQKEKELAQEKTLLPLVEPITGKPAKPKFVGSGFNVATLPCVLRTPAVNA